MPKFVRARQGVGVLRHPESGALAAPNPAVPVDASDPLVKAFPWAFVSDEDLAAEQADEAVAYRPSAIELARRADEANAAREAAAKEADAEGVRLAKARAAGKKQGDEEERDAEPEVVEAATARPGEKRSTRRTRK